MAAVLLLCVGGADQFERHGNVVKFFYAITGKVIGVDGRKPGVVLFKIELHGIRIAGSPVINRRSSL